MLDVECNKQYASLYQLEPGNTTTLSNTAKLIISTDNGIVGECTLVTSRNLSNHEQLFTHKIPSISLMKRNLLLKS